MIVPLEMPFGMLSILVGVALGMASTYAFVFGQKKTRARSEADCEEIAKKKIEAMATQKHQQPSTGILPCIRNRCSIFPRDYKVGDEPVEKEVVDRLLEAAMWAPFHGPLPPWRFVVLGRDAMVKMQEETLEFYDKNWESAGRWKNEEDYCQWRHMTEDEITGRWGPVSYMIAIVMRRQAGSKRIPEWEEAAATACAVQNMHIQATAEKGLACYWSSWHSAYRDSEEMREFLAMGKEDKCLGLFIVAKDGKTNRSDLRQRNQTNCVEWRN